jgi:hypothetical protein
MRYHNVLLQSAQRLNRFININVEQLLNATSKRPLQFLEPPTEGAVPAPTLSLLQTMVPIKTAAFFKVSAMAISRLYYLTSLEQKFLKQGVSPAVSPFEVSL